MIRRAYEACGYKLWIELEFLAYNLCISEVESIP
jgi:hypothetical protein